MVWLRLLLLGKLYWNDDVCLVLGDNIFMDMVFRNITKCKKNVTEGKSTVFGYYVNDPERYGVAEFD